MIENLPAWIELLFAATLILTLGFFHFANGKPSRITGLIIVWSLIHAILALNGFYQDTESIPPRFGLILIPATLVIFYGLLPTQIEKISLSRNRLISTFSHIIRIPVEIVLYYLFVNEMIPELMTFEGRNFDILIGFSAPIVGFFIYKKWIGKKGLIGWNFIGLCFVLFILFNGILSAELPFQQFAFEQPNRAISYFPFVLLPATIVPLVVWTHLSDIFLLRKELKS